MKWDTGATLTLIDLAVASPLKLDLNLSCEVPLTAAGGQQLSARLIPLTLLICDSQGRAAEWTTEIGIIDRRLKNNLCGFFGFRQFFQYEETIDLHAEISGFRLRPLKSFQGSFTQSKSTRN